MCERVSSVEPDFEAEMKSVPSVSTRRTALGCVVSSVSNASTRKSRFSTSGARLEPPIPSRQTRSNSTCANRSSSSCTRSCMRSGSSSQPSHFASSPPVQTLASRLQIRSTSSAVPDRHAETSSPRFALMPSSSSANESENFWTPSRSSVSVTSS